MEQTIIAENRRGTSEDYYRASKNDEWGKITNKIFTFVLNHRVEKSSMKNTRTNEDIKFPNSYTIKLIDRIIDEKGGTKIIRYLPTEETIYFSDQMSEDKNEAVYAEFVRGVKHIPGSDRYLLEYFMNCNANGSNLKRDKSKDILFYMVDGAEGLKDVVIKKKKSFDLAKWCYDGNWEDVSSYARALGFDIKSYDSSEIRHNLAVLAENDPETFEKGKENPVNKRKHYTYEAVDRGILEVKHETRGVHWAGSVTPISAAAPGVDPVSAFAEYTFTTQGQQVYAELMERLNPKKSDVTTEAHIPAKQVEYTPSPNYTGINYDDAKKLAEDAVSLGVVTKPSTNTFEFMGEKIKSWSDLITKLKDDKFFLDALTDAVKSAKN